MQARHEQERGQTGARGLIAGVLVAYITDRSILLAEDTEGCSGSCLRLGWNGYDIVPLRHDAGSCGSCDS